MNSYNVVIKDANEGQHQFGISASSWANAIIAAKQRVSVATDASTDDKLLIVQWTGKIDIVGT